MECLKIKFEYKRHLKITPLLWRLSLDGFKMEKYQVRSVQGKKVFQPTQMSKDFYEDTKIAENGWWQMLCN